MNMVVLDADLINPGDVSWAPLDALGRVTYYDFTSQQQVQERMAGADVVFVNRLHIGEEEMAAAENLRYIGVFATGYNLIDLDAAARRGITVTNAPGYSTLAVAQHTAALMLSLAGNIAAFDSAVHAGNWLGAIHLPMVALYGKTLGVIGFGEIGRAVGRIARALGMQVLAAGSRETAEGRAIARYVAMEELQASADVVSLHCPLTETTRGMVNEAFLAALKPGAMLINTARGGLVDQAALATALRSGALRAAALDVTEPEPLPECSPLFTAPNCIITPHVAWAAPEARNALIELVAGNYAAFAAGKPVNVVGGNQAK